MNETERVTSVPVLPARAADSHKGTFGRALIVGGSRRMSGAVSLSANAALRGGAGLVEFAAPETVQLTIAALCPCATSMPLACGADGQLAREAVAQVRSRAELATAVAVGPGFDIGQTQRDIVQAVLEQDKPAVIDADGLNNLCTIADWPSLRRCGLVLTPHPGEFARLTGRPVKEVQASREALAVEAARMWHGRLAHASQGHLAPAEANSPANPPLVLVLKGAGTIVTDGRRVYVNTTGNPGMATGGTGDVLTGLTVSFLAQGLAPFDAAVLAVFVHGRAGDLAAEELGQPSLIATDLIDYLPHALRLQVDAEPF